MDENREVIQEKSTEASSENKFYLPENVFESDVRANVLFPQMFGAQTVISGAEVVGLLKDRKMTWGQYEKAELSPEQLQKSREQVARVHKAYNIPARIPSDKDLNKTIVNATRGEIKSRIVDYTKAMGLELQLTSDIGENEARKNKLIETLFSDPQYESHAQALVRMWQSSAEAVQADDAKELGKNYRNSFKFMRDATTDRAELKRFWEIVGDKLKGIIHNGAHSQLDVIKQEIGVKIPSGVADDFANRMSTTPAKILR